MYPGELGKKYADRPAFIMASTGKEVTYAEFEGRANQLAHYLRSINLKFKAIMQSLWKIMTDF